MNTFRRFLTLAAVGLALGIAPFSRATTTISTLAGFAGTGSANGSGSGATFSNPQAVAVDAGGKIYVADTANHIIRVITPSGSSSTLAGLAGVAGSADGTGSTARFNQPAGIAVDSLTNIYVADYGNNTIRQISPLGAVTTIAGVAGSAGSSNGVGALALFSQPMGLATDTANNLYVADYGNHLIRKMTPAHLVSTLAGTAGVFGYTNGPGTAAVFYGPEAVTLDQAGNVYVADTGNAAIRKITSGGVVTLVAGTPGSLGSADGTAGSALFFQPAGITLDSATNLLVADYFNNTIRKITTAGVVTTVAGLAGNAGSADGTNSTARFWGPQGLAVNSAGTIYAADSVNNAIRAISLAGLVTTLAGSPSDGSADGPAGIARFYSPQSIATDSSGNLYIADAQNSVIRKITLTGVVSVLAGSPGVFGSTDGTGTNAFFAGPQGVALDASGNVFVADTGNHTIRKITSAGLVSTVAGAAGNPGNADGAGANAQFNTPIGIAVDNSSRVYVADSGNHTIRRITLPGTVITLAGAAGAFGSVDGATNNARFNSPIGIAFSPASGLFVTDYNNHTIRLVTLSGSVTTIAGSPGVWGSSDGLNNNALFYAPSGIAVDSSGNVYVTDSGNNTLRKITPSGADWSVTTATGVPGLSGSVDSGSGAAVLFYHPSGIAVNSAGYLFVTDAGNNTIRTSEALTILTWAAPAAVTYGTAIGNAQLNASAPIAGTFAYNPVSGTVLNSGTNMLAVQFTPQDAVNNRGASATVNLAVLPASLTVTAGNARRATGLPNPPFGGTIAGLQNSDNITATYSSIATPASPAGGYPIVPNLVDPNNRQTNYVVTLVNGTLTVVVAPAIQSETRSGNSFNFTFSSISNQMYQIQYSTNLSQTNWFSLGAPVTATNSTITISDTGAAAVKFYRISLYP